jgi:hypothetical protein
MPGHEPDDAARYLERSYTRVYGDPGPELFVKLKEMHAGAEGADNGWFILVATFMHAKGFPHGHTIDAVSGGQQTPWNALLWAIDVDDGPDEG